MAATRAPGRQNPIPAAAVRGDPLFTSVGCAVCHTRTLQTAPPGTSINGGAFTVPAALGNKIIHPFSDFALHNIGTGDGIVQNGGQESECGWCKDKWGFSWQITPRVLLEATTSPDKAAAKRAFDAMMTMQKIDVARIEAAVRGDTVDA